MIDGGDSSLDPWQISFNAVRYDLESVFYQG